MGNLKSVGVAVHDDIPLLARHHRLMFEEIRGKTGLPVDPSVMPEPEKNDAEKRVREFISGVCIAWIADSGNRIVSSGVVSMASYVPVPRDSPAVLRFFTASGRKEITGIKGMHTRLPEKQPGTAGIRESDARTCLPVLPDGPCMKKPGSYRYRI